MNSLFLHNVNPLAHFFFHSHTKTPLPFPLINSLQKSITIVTHAYDITLKLISSLSYVTLATSSLMDSPTMLSSHSKAPLNASVTSSTSPPTLTATPSFSSPNGFSMSIANI
ncbi:hypothetical protein VNO77_08080 [Canavalia gladiata]|uniref:Uncharacterized protein n=1 Tax=Canavalia gladiata TaxID=3824 RepID=A0AAN9M924_CANGL